MGRIVYRLAGLIPAFVIDIINVLLRKLTLVGAKLQFIKQWGSQPNPKWFDHYLDLYYFGGLKDGNCHWLERGVFSNLAIKNGAKVLELCCGDGFNAKYFYRYKADAIYSCDFDKTAIEHAQKYNCNEKTKFFIADIRSDIPDEHFDNIIWNAAMAYFTPEEIEGIMKNIKKCLGADGILSGQTIVEKSGGKQIEYHEYEFKSKEDLMRFFTPYFKNVKVFETMYPNRHNLYFYASDGVLPLSDDWEHMIDKK